jgi:hypothetical protein
VRETDDPHYQKMKVYKEVPVWWYVAILIGTFGLALGMAYAADSGLPWWGLIVALLFAFLFIPVVGTVG